MSDDPALIHLDTNHLVNIARLRNDERLDSADKHRWAYRRVSDWIQDGACALTFYPTLLFEWLDGCFSDRCAQQIAMVLDSASTLVRVELSLYTFKLELLDGIRSLFPTLPIPSAPIVQSMSSCQGINVLRQFDPDVADALSAAATDSTDLPTTARDWIPHAQKLLDQLPGCMKENLSIFQRFIDECTEHGHKQSALLRFAALRSAEGILQTLCPDETPDELIQRLDLRLCRGLSLHTMVLWHYIRLNPKLHENDILDLDQAHVPAYVDFVLTETRMRDLLHRADKCLRSTVFSSPTEFVERLDL